MYDDKDYSADIAKKLQHNFTIYFIDILYSYSMFYIKCIVACETLSSQLLGGAAKQKMSMVEI